MPCGGLIHRLILIRVRHTAGRPTLEEEEKQGDPDIPLTRYMGSVAGRIMELVQDYQAITDRDWIPMENIYELVALLYHGTVGWEDIKRMAWVDLGVSGNNGPSEFGTSRDGFNP